MFLALSYLDMTHNYKNGTELRLKGGAELTLKLSLEVALQ